MRKATLTNETLRKLRARQARLQELWIMTPTQRVAAMRRGELSLERNASRGVRVPIGGE